MKILWMSDSPTSPSGFGNVTRFVCAGLAMRGHQVSILGWQAHGSPVRWQNCTLYPMRLDSFGADVLLTYLQKLQPELLVTLADVWWLTYIASPFIASFMRTAGIPWALYYPIDGDSGEQRLPPSWVHILETVNLPIAMSQYGRDVTIANGIKPAYIPHGVDTTVFRPPPDRALAKRAFAYEDRFVVLSDARNQPRKLLPRTLEIFRRFAAGKDDVLLHLHCDPHDPAAQSPEYTYDLRSDIAFLGLEDKVRMTAQMNIAVGLPLSGLAALYQAADVHLLSSWGEGFGLPTLQAAAAGVVPMAADYTASRELVLGHGEPIRVQHFLLDQFGLRRALIDIDDAVARLDKLYADRTALAAKAHAARAFAEPYDWTHIVAQWHDLLQREAPGLRTRVRHAPTTAQVTLQPRTLHPPSDMDRTVRAAISALPEGAQVTLNVVERKAGQLMAGLLRDTTGNERRLTMPVTLPVVDPSLVQTRVTGCIYLASASDVGVIQQLSRLFPGLNAWSTVAFDVGVSRLTERPVPVKVVPAASPAFRRHLAASTLALDLGAADAALPALAAALGVPCIGLRRQACQQELWPALTLDQPDIAVAAMLGRWMLTDQGDATTLCTQARQALNRRPVAMATKEVG